MSSLDAAIARAYGIDVATDPWLPAADAEAEAFLRAAIEIGRAIGDRRSAPPPVDEPWEPLPRRPVAPASGAERSAAVARALAWAAAGGARWDGIEVRIDGDGAACIRATRALAIGETILVVPRRLMIVQADRDELALWLSLEARDPASRWRGYLDVVPAQLDELPVFHDAADLGALAGTAAHTLATEENRSVRAAYAELPPEVRARASLADLAWGRAILRSRGFHAPGSIEPKIALIPIVDFFNHRRGDTTWSFDPAIGDYVVSTERAFAAGEEVGFEYGDRSNTRLLVHYGFTAPGAPGEAALLFERAATPTADVAARLLWSLPLAAPGHVLVGTSLDERMFRAFAVARLHAASAADLDRVAERGLTPRGDLPWLGATVEEAALAILGDAARRALAELDAHAPRSAGGGPWDRSCALVRDSERAVLAQIVDLASGGDSPLAQSYRRAIAALRR